MYEDTTLNKSICPLDWNWNSLGEVIVSSEYGTSKPTNGSSGIPVLRMGNMREGKIDINNLAYVELEDKELKKLSLNKGDILINRTNSPELVGKVALFDLDGVYVCASYIVRFQINKDIINPFYVNYYMNTENSQKYIKSLATKAVQQSNINPTVLKKAFKIIFPNALAEQQKIINILSTWDKAIELKEKLIEEKKKQKKGLMQKLLTGEKRLNGFNGDWLEAKLVEYGTTYSGLTGKCADEFGNGMPYIPYRTVFESSKINTKKINFVSISKEEKQNKVMYGDIFFTISSETAKEVAVSSALLDEVGEMYLNSFCFGYRLHNFQTLLPEYLRYYFSTGEFRKKVWRYAQGSTRFNISKSEIMKIKIKIPPIEEQKEISVVLNAISESIEFLQQELQALKQQKKGLMQLLLTGIVRVGTEDLEQ